MITVTLACPEFLKMKRLSKKVVTGSTERTKGSKHLDRVL